MKKNRLSVSTTPWHWIPSLYFMQGIPYVLVMSVSVLLYKRMGISNKDIALFTGLLYLPWVLKPFWSPFVDIFKSKRWWILSMQGVISVLFLSVAFFIPFSFFFKATLLVFWFMAFASATHDIAADGFYMLGLDDSAQSFFVGIRSTFYRLSMIAGQGGLVILAGYLESYFSSHPIVSSSSAVIQAWCFVFYGLALFFVFITIYHRLVLPKPQIDAVRRATLSSVFGEFVDTFVSFFRKKNIGMALLFMLCYRLSEAMLVKLAPPFMIDGREVGGLGLSLEQIGFAYGTLGALALTLGGIIGGFFITTFGLKRCMFPMALAITLPNMVYVFLSIYQPLDLWIVYVSIVVEQFGYGLGFTAYMMYLMYFSQGKYQTSHYAISTGFMALGMMLPGMIAGWIQEQLGYAWFFKIVVLLIIPTLLIVPAVSVRDDFGKRKKQ